MLVAACYTISPPHKEEVYAFQDANLLVGIHHSKSTLEMTTQWL